MHYTKLTRLLLLVALLGISGFAISQPPRGPLVISPQVNAGKTITFRYLAPGAKEVKLNAQFEKGPVPMVKDTVGIWSVTTGPVTPDIYPYSFIVDGITVMDPANVAFSPTSGLKPAW